jgi:hypothetical protein
VLERAAARGELRADTDIRLATDVIAGPLFYRYLMSGGPVDEPLARDVVAIVLRAFAPDPSG